MILEGIAAHNVIKKKTSLGDDGFGDNTLSGTEIAADVMIALIIVFIYLFLVIVAVYSAYQCNKNNPSWLALNIIICIFFPAIYLLVHPNMMLAHEGSKSYCDSE